MKEDPTADVDFEELLDALGGVGGLIRSLDEDEVAELFWLFRHSQALENVRERLVAVYRDENVLWLVQDAYRGWHDYDFVEFRGQPVVHSPMRSSRLICVTDAPGEDKSAKIVATVILRWRSRANLGEFPVSIGRTLIMEPHRFVPEDAFLLLERYSVFIPDSHWGRMSFWTFPFAQQDVEHHRCADVSLWMMCDFLSRHVGAIRLPVGVRKGASRSENHMLPAAGLYPDEIRHMIALAGLAPVHYALHELQVPVVADPKDSKSQNGAGERSLDVMLRAIPAERGVRRVSRLLFFEILHAYIDSQLPVILTIGRWPVCRDGVDKPIGRKTDVQPAVHSLCVVGHTTYEMDRPAETDATKFSDDHWCVTTTLYVKHLVVHDDDVGPFTLLPLRESDANHDLHRGDLAYLWDESVEQNGIGMYVGLPPEVRMPADVAFMAATSALRQEGYLRRYIEGFELLWGRRIDGPSAVVGEAGIASRFVQVWKARQLLCSLFLDHSSRIRQSVFVDPDVDERTKLVYAALPLPKFVWVFEMSSGTMSSLDRRVEGELLIDPTYGPSLTAIRAIRAPGVFLVRGSGGQWCSPMKSTFRARRAWTLRNFDSVG